MIFKEKANFPDPTKLATFTVEITDDQVFPNAYNECQKILKKNCLEDPFLCGKAEYYITNMIQLYCIPLKRDILHIKTSVVCCNAVLWKQQNY